MDIEVKRFIDALPGLVWTAHPDGSVEYVNRHWRKYTGLSLKDAMGTGWHSVIFPADRELLLAGWASVLRGDGPDEIKTRLRRHDGEYRRFLVRAAPIRTDSGKVVRWCGISTDIEDWVNAESEYALKQFAVAQQLSLTGSFAADIWSDDHKWSDELYRIFGIVPGTKIFNHIVRAHVYDKDLAAFDGGFQQSLAHHTDFDQFFRIVTPDGRLKHLHAVARVTHGLGDRPLFVGAIRDITESKVAEEALIVSEAELRRTLRHLNIAQQISETGSLAADVLNDRHFWSEELYRIFELDQGTHLTLDLFRSFVHPEDLPKFNAALRDAIRNRRDYDETFRIITRSGTVKDVHCTAYLAEDEPGQPIFFGALRDITEARQAQEELMRRTEELQGTLRHLTIAQELSATGSYTADVQVDQHIWSEELYRVFDFDPATPPNFQRVLDCAVPEDLPLLQAAIEGSMSGRDVNFIFRIMTRDGSVKHLRGVGRVSHHVEGRPVLTGAVQDITQNKIVEEALNRARNELAHVSRISALSAVTASIAHEVNQPLAGIITNASTCLRMLAADPPNIEGAQATAQRTIRDGNRASDVIKRLRALFARKELAIEPVDLNDAAREVLTLCSSELQSRRVMLGTDFHDQSPQVLGDRVQLQQVMMNLILNAAEAMDEVSAKSRNLIVSSSPGDSGDALIRVRDTGKGINPEHVDRLFDAFFSTKEKGMGIGLSISRSIIENHGGRLWATANEEGGTTFSFALPAIPEHASSAITMERSAPPRRRAKPSRGKGDA